MVQEILGNFCGTQFLEKVIFNWIKLQKNKRLSKLANINQ